MKVKGHEHDTYRYQVKYEVEKGESFQSPNSDHTVFTVPVGGTYQISMQGRGTGKAQAMEAAITAMELSMQKQVLPYLVGRAEVDPALLGILPDPNTCREQSLRFNVARPVERNFMGEVISHQESDALVFEKIIVREEGSSVPVGLTWKQRGFNPMVVPENRLKFAKEAFGLTDEEVKELLGAQNG